MRSVLLSLVLGVSALGLALATPAQGRADDDFRRGGFGRESYGRGYYGRNYYNRGFYNRGYGNGYFGGYPSYNGYGVYGVRRFSYPGVYGGGYNPWGGYGVRPYSGFYNAPGYFW